MDLDILFRQTDKILHNIYIHEVMRYSQINHRFWPPLSIFQKRIKTKAVHDTE